MDSVYKWSRIFALIFVVFLFMVVTLPVVFMLLLGVDETTVPALFTAALFLIPLVFMALSFRFMHKNETEKKKRIGLAMLLLMLLGLFIFSLYYEKQTEMLEKERVMVIQNEESRIMAEALKEMIESVETEKTLEELPVNE